MHLNEDDLVLHYYGEMPSDEEARAATHLAACGVCQDNYATLQRVMAFVDSAPAVEAEPGFERIAWARLEPALAQSRRSGWIAWFLYSPSRLDSPARSRRGRLPTPRPRGRRWRSCSH